MQNYKDKIIEFIRLFLLSLFIIFVLLILPILIETILRLYLESRTIGVLITSIYLITFLYILYYKKRDKSKTFLENFYLFTNSIRKSIKEIISFITKIPHFFKLTGNSIIKIVGYIFVAALIIIPIFIVIIIMLAIIKWSFQIVF
ncbi:MAG: hypothetical protein US71_C0001G0058 [Parcubacteria group bacterium GW2011_GWD2_38_12]|nr:MAG: hypothetical protein US06_C0001G0057 [Parcubacteria group bacterium GW2011_GWC2_36_17]KKQ43925.1 MAG: hypothetical protein US61_C0001G0038 [Parcubacteria group bacterium GW2011_GWE2_37_8]KKQ52855.1 MAG: hypothetical protein US71_C0001G0058 [Parcubacteria group bacterium GW2011_GWD2_38_12]KKQ59058.1 MAG: hypothetical protein US79_C0001G0057 [Parcubacteria group bacterium GW2011_GWC1_38_17]KKQ59673.1 MAG: hypothetical protein US78_C0001G0033 [Parcubacteria group bacterium GW2011_GWD1_38_1